MQIPLQASFGGMGGVQPACQASSCMRRLRAATSNTTACCVARIVEPSSSDVSSRTSSGDTAPELRAPKALPSIAERVAQGAAAEARKANPAVDILPPDVQVRVSIPPGATVLRCDHAWKVPLCGKRKSLGGPQHESSPSGQRTTTYQQTSYAYVLHLC